MDGRPGRRNKAAFSNSSAEVCVSDMIRNPRRSRVELSPALSTALICFSVAPSANPRPRQLVCLRPVGILKNDMLNLNYLFHHLVLLALKSPIGGVVS